MCSHLVWQVNSTNYRRNLILVSLFPSAPKAQIGSLLKLNYCHTAESSSVRSWKSHISWNSLTFMEPRRCIILFTRARCRFFFFSACLEVFKLFWTCSVNIRLKISGTSFIDYQKTKLTAYLIDLNKGHHQYEDWYTVEVLIQFSFINVLV
jgi:hypothetical protein